MNSLSGGAVIYAKDRLKVATFYEQVAGMRLRHSADDFVVLESGGFQVVVIQAPPRIAETLVIASPPVRREQAAIKPVFYVDDFARARDAATRCGGALNDAPREWSFGDTRVCDGMDPEGNVFQLRVASKS